MRESHVTPLAGDTVTPAGTTESEAQRGPVSSREWLLNVLEHYGSRELYELAKRNWSSPAFRWWPDAL